MNSYLEKAEQSGLLDVIKEWIKTEKYVSVSMIQRSFSVGFNTSTAIFNYLVEEGLIEKNPTHNKGHKVVSFEATQLTIYLLDVNPANIKELRKAFQNYKEVIVVEDNFDHFMKIFNDVECIVSPANSFGSMSGGYDRAIRDYFGLEVEYAVKRYINTNLFGEQRTGTAFIIDVPNTNKKLIHCPTMRWPQPLKDKTVIYHCMRTTLIEAIKNNIHSIVIPSFGGATGKVEPHIIAKYMKEGYEQIMNHIGEKYGKQKL